MRRFVFLGLVGGLGLWALQQESRSRTEAGPSISAERTITSWPESSRTAATQMVQKYGQPDGITANRLIWHNKAPWREIVVDREEVPHSFPKPHVDVLLQSVNFRVPPDKFDDLAEYDGSVIAERTKGTLSARCDKEPMNFLALNLAHDVATGKRSVSEARTFYTETAMAAMKGDMRPYTQRLQFSPPASAGDPDKPMMK